MIFNHFLDKGKHSMKILITATALALTLTGCATIGSHQLTQPEGQWQPINHAGFVPAGVQRYLNLKQSKAVTDDEVNDGTI